MSHFQQYLNQYTFETTLPGTGEKITFKPVTTGQLKKVLLFETSKDPDVIEKALDDIMNECVVKPEKFDVGDLFLQDRFFLLLEIRKATKGSTYTLQSQCTSCGSQSQQNINLSTLPLVTLEKNTKKKKVAVKKSRISEVKEDLPDEDQQDEWNVVKITDDISVRLTFITRNMQRESLEIASKDENATETQKMVLLASLISANSILEIITPTGVDKDLPLKERLQFLDGLTENQLESITSWFDKNKFGVEFVTELKCRHCGHTEKKEIPTENFFF